jgi:hypothetical protein
MVGAIGPSGRMEMAIWECRLAGQAQYFCLVQYSCVPTRNTQWGIICQFEATKTCRPSRQQEPTTASGSVRLLGARAMLLHVKPDS